MSTPEKIVILGHTGFIGKALSEDFVHQKVSQVIGYSSSRVNLESKGNLDPLAQVLDRGALFVVAIRIREEEDSLRLFERTVTMISNLAGLLKIKPVQKCIYFSSASVYGDRISNFSLNEQTPVHPTSFYAKAKLACEGMLQEVADQCRFPLLIPRPCNVYGPGDRYPTYGPTRFIRQILKEKEVCLYGDGQEQRDQLYIEDLVRIVRGLSLGEFSGIYNCASGRSYSFIEILQLLKGVVPCDFTSHRQKRTRPLVDQQFDITKLLQAIPKDSFTDIQTGLQKTYQFICQEIAQEKAIHA